MESLLECFSCYLAVKMVFLVAITSIRRVSKLQALMVETSIYLIT